MVSCGYINMLHIASRYNFAVILTKHWGYQGPYYHKLIQLVFYYEGNTATLFLDDTLLEVDVLFDEEKLIAQ